MRGKIPISNSVSERPKEANDRKSRFLICRKLEKKTAECVKKALIEVLNGQRLFSVTPDRGKEFSLNAEITKALGVEFYFPPPHHPWIRGTNENTNGLLREFFPKGQDLTDISNAYLQAKVSDLNHRPRKCLGYKTPAEIYFSTSLHFI